MPLFERMKADIGRRAAILPAEVAQWKQIADQDALGDQTKDVGKMGIHQSQLEALKLMMDGLQVRQQQLLDKLDPAGTPQNFSTGYLDLSDEIVSAHELWRIFRYIIALHKDPTLGPLVDAADLIAADCYLTCMKKVRDLGLVTENQFRAPPLVFLEAEMSPSTASRGFSAGAAGFPLRRYRNMRLPIPLILLPSDTASSMWMLSTLHHEVGHNLDADLKLQQEMGRHLLTCLEGRETLQDLQKLWWQWTAEILADAFGVLLGAAGFAHALCWWLMVLAPEPKFQPLNNEDVHPPFLVRIHLIAAMLRHFQIAEFDAAAKSIMDTWETQPKPPWVASFIADSEAVAKLFLTQPLDAIGARPLTELVPDVADDVRRVGELEKFLRTGLVSPDPKLDRSAKWRHVPVAAQLAFFAQATPDTAALERIQTRAFDYLTNLDRPKKMGDQDQSVFFQQLVSDLKFN